MNKNIKVTRVFKELVDGYIEGKRVFVLEGGTRSSKSYSIVDFIEWLIFHEKLKNQKFTFCRNFFTVVETTVYETFHKNQTNKGFFDPARLRQKPLKYTWHLGNLISFIGLDDPQKAHGREQYLTWIDEAIEVSPMAYYQLNQRTSDVMILSFNPSDPDSWIFQKLLKKDNVKYIHSTYKDNPFLDEKIIKDVEEYEPTPENIEKGTADAYMWDVYGLGKRAELKGRIYTNIKQYTELPENAELIGYGVDFGFSEDPAVCIKVWKQKNTNNLFIKQIIHKTGLTDDDLAAKMFEHGYQVHEDVVADSAEPKAIAVLKRNKIRVHHAYKKKDSVRSGIKAVKNYNLHIYIQSQEVYKDFLNYVWKWDDVEDKPLNEPDRKFKHSPDALAYLVVKLLHVPEKAWG